MKKFTKFLKKYSVVLVVAFILGIVPSLMVKDYSPQFNEVVNKINKVDAETNQVKSDEELNNLKKQVNSLKDQKASLEKQIQAKENK